MEWYRGRRLGNSMKVGDTGRNPTSKAVGNVASDNSEQQ